jgi:hypothetical protein
LALVDMTTIEPDDEGTHMDASVAVELADGSKRMRATKEAPATLFFHDRATAIRLFEQRLMRCGFSAGHGEAIATSLFDAVRDGGAFGIRELLDRIGCA